MSADRARPRHDATTEAHNLLMAQLEQLTTSDHWLTMLDMTRRFHSYSARNVLLLIAQGAQGRVAGYRTWQTIPAQDGRHCQVRRGATGMLVLAPVTRTITQTDDTTGEPTRRRVLAGFKAVRVFDEAALVSPPAIPDVKPELLAGQAPGRLFDALATQVHDAGFTLTDGDCAPANGQTNWVSRQVILRPGLDHAQRTKTLAHELAHIHLHDPETHPRDKGFSRARAEVEAESVAYLVCSQAGLDSAEYTIPYVAHWSNGNLDLIADTAERSVGTARAITGELGRHLGLEQPHPAPTEVTPHGRGPQELDRFVVARRVERDASAAIERLAANPAKWGADPDDVPTIESLAAPQTPTLRPDPLARARRSIANAQKQPQPRAIEPPGPTLS